MGKFLHSLAQAIPFRKKTDEFEGEQLRVEIRIQKVLDPIPSRKTISSLRLGKQPRSERASNAASTISLIPDARGR
jgi:hypothetical protein